MRRMPFEHRNCGRWVGLNRNVPSPSRKTWDGESSTKPSLLVAVVLVDSLLGFKLFLELEELSRRPATERRGSHHRADPTGTFRRLRVASFVPRQSALVFSFFLLPPSVHRTLAGVVRIG